MTICGRRVVGRICLVVALASAAAPVVGQSLPRLRVSDNRRFLVTADGAPFFWLGDTAWELFHRLTREDAERYLRRRAEQRFTVVQAVALAEFDGLQAPNAYGERPLLNNDPTRPNEAYFAHVDWIVARANALGIYVGFLPTWGDKWNQRKGAGPEVFTPANAERYGEWLGRRYRDAGIVWIVGGDRPVETDTHREIIRAMAKGLRAGDGGAHLITFHPPGGQSSSTWFHDESWLDFNMRQNGHVAEFTGRYDQTRADYDRSPIKPVLDGEPIYEDHPVSFDAKRLGHSISADVRRPLYWDLFTGAFGHTYGHHSVWQMWTKDRTPINNPLLPWTEAVDQPGAAQMQHGRALMESRPFLTRVPDQDVLVSGRVPTAMPGAGRYQFVATRDVDGTYAMVYAPTSRPFTVRLSTIRGATVRAWWFNPRDGSATSIGSVDNTGERTFTPPTPGEMIDWVLVLDDAARNYPAPGRRESSRRVRPEDLMTRREMLASTGSTLAWLSIGGVQAQGPMLKNMGGEPPGFGHRSRAGNFDILEHCRSLGLGAVRMRLPSTDLAAARELRKKIEGYGMRVIISLSPPRDAAGLAEYEAGVRAVSALGAVTTHASFTARRYEEFETFEAFKASFERHQRSVELAEPVLRKHKVKLAIENHKGWRAAEHVAWIRRVGSEWVGACYDFGNNISLCEDPADTLRLLAPVTIFVSFKDMAVAPYEEGFLLSEMALGEGMLDIPGMVKVLQQKDPNMIFALEMITRDPLKIPVFTKKYWATFDDSYSPLPGRDLARILEIVGTNPPKTPLTRTSGLSTADSLKLEDDLINRSIAYARKNLPL